MLHIASHTIPSSSRGARDSRARLNTMEESIAWLSSLPSSTSGAASPPGKKLRAIDTLLTLCGNPHKKFFIIHVGGSKGKSTITATAGALLHEKGYTTGVFISPHIHAYNERIRINNAPITDADFIASLNFIRQRVREHGKVVPTVFEALTAAGLYAFARADCEWVVLEVGIGGRFDTTNIVHPALCVLSEIEYEHTDILGKHIKKIANDKAGIIKHGVPVWVGPQPYRRVLNVLRRTAHKQNSELYYLPDMCAMENISIQQNCSTATIRYLSSKNTGAIKKKTSLLYKQKSTRSHNSGYSRDFRITCPVSGRALLEDCVLAYHATQKIPAKPDSTQFYTANNSHNDTNDAVVLPPSVALPARCEILPPADTSPKASFKTSMPPLFLDGAHTRHSISRACESIAHLFSRAALIVGIIKNKNIRAITSVLFRYRHIFPRVFITPVTAGATRAAQSDHERLYTTVHKHFRTTRIDDTVQMCTNEEDALIRARAWYNATREKDAPHNFAVCVMGSLYLCATVRRLYMNT